MTRAASKENCKSVTDFTVLGSFITSLSASFFVKIQCVEWFKVESNARR